MRQKLDTTKVGRVTSQLSYVPGLPFQGREHTVIIGELAKAGWRYIGDSRDKKPDAFLIKTYGLKDVHRATLLLTGGGSYAVWVGRPTNDAGEKELRRLSSDKLPWITRETLPDSIAKGYVMSREATDKEKADRQRADDERRMVTGRESAKSLSEEKLREILATAKDTLKRKYISDYDKHMKPTEIEIVLSELQRRGLSEKPSRRKKVEAVTETSLQSVHDSRSSLSKSSDERQEHSLIVEPDDPRVERWMRDAGTMDVRGIDTLTKQRAGSRKAKPRRRIDNPTSVRRIRR